MASQITLRLQRQQQISILYKRHYSHSIRHLAQIPKQTLPFSQRCYFTGSTIPPIDVQALGTKHHTQAPRWIPPPRCIGCGAPSQQSSPMLPGYYPIEPRKRVDLASASSNISSRKLLEENKLWEEALKRVERNPNLLHELGMGDQVNLAGVETQDQRHRKVPEHLIRDIPPPLCSRCHNLIHHHHAPSLPAYPTLDTLSSLLMSSRHKHNHIYHLIDAADFPLTLHPELRNHLYNTLPKAITRNLTVSYIITRCDILMPKRPQIASLMTYLKSTIKDFLPKGEKVESSGLSNTKFYAISTRNGWDIGELKDEIARRQGGVWFLGAVNVGKSSLLREIWPMDGDLRPPSLEDAAEFEILPEENESELEKSLEPIENFEQTAHRTSNRILTQTSGKSPQFRASPTISDIPGTTAAPIRVSYKSIGRGGKYRGEVVDLPGLERWVGFKETGLMKYVRKDRWRKLFMRMRVIPKQYAIKSGQSMLIGGLVMITPITANTVVLVNPFISLPVHIASTPKCIGFLAHQDPAGALRYPDRLFQDPTSVGTSVPIPQVTSQLNDTKVGTSGLHDTNELKKYLPSAFASAGVFTLSNDVTVIRNPMLIDRSQNAIAQLPYKVLATDILLSGIGWLEVTAQVRNRQNASFKPIEIEIFSPEGKGIGQRRTMGAYMRLEQAAREQGLRKKTTRPRRSMKGQKKLAKGIYNRTA